MNSAITIICLVRVLKTELNFKKLHCVDTKYISIDHCNEDDHYDGAILKGELIVFLYDITSRKYFSHIFSNHFIFVSK